MEIITNHNTPEHNMGECGLLHLVISLNVSGEEILFSHTQDAGRAVN